MRYQERLEARRIRREEGLSIGAIAKLLHCSKSSVSEWVRDIPLTSEQIAKLMSRERASEIAASHTNAPKQKFGVERADIEASAVRDVGLIDKDRLRIIGAALYWAEGAKDRNMVAFVNSDPNMIRLMMRFFREVCNVEETNFRGSLNIHPHLDVESALVFWSSVTGIPISQFYKTQLAVSKASVHHRADRLPKGTFRISISDTRLCCKIRGWIRGLYKIGE
jgi:transcriptional regulator with XRE-family HTH domain